MLVSRFSTASISCPLLIFGVEPLAGVCIDEDRDAISTQEQLGLSTGFKVSIGRCLSDSPIRLLVWPQQRPGIVHPSLQIASASLTKASREQICGPRDATYDTACLFTAEETSILYSHYLVNHCAYDS